MTTPSDQMRSYIGPVWQIKDYQEDILWAGIFGSVSRNRAHEKSDVDILIVLKEHERSGEPIDLREKLAEACGREVSRICIWQGQDWCWGHVRLEALLSSRTVYGNRADVEHLRREAVDYLNDGLKRLNLIAEAVKKIKNLVINFKTYEDFIHPAQQAMRWECVEELRDIVNLLDNYPHHHPIRTMLIPYAFEHAEKIRALLDQVQPDLASVARGVPVWRTVWDCLQPNSNAMKAFRDGCAVGGRNYIRHILASKKLADVFEEGGEVDDSMYNEIIR